MDVDVVVIGLGPGAGMPPARGSRSWVSNGECPYFGCVPSKMMIRAADSLAEARRPGSRSPAGRAARLDTGGRPAGDPDDWDDRVAVERLETAGVTVGGRTPGRSRPRRGGPDVRALPPLQHRQLAASISAWPIRRTGPTATRCDGRAAGSRLALASLAAARARAGLLPVLPSVTVVEALERVLALRSPSRAG